MIGWASNELRRILQANGDLPGLPALPVDRHGSPLRAVRLPSVNESKIAGLGMPGRTLVNIMHNPRDGWHLDKKVPIGLFVGLIAQTVVIVVWTTQKFESYDHRLGSLEKSDLNQSSHETRIVKLEEQFDFIKSDLGEIKDLLRRQVPNDGGK